MSALPRHLLPVRKARPLKSQEVAKTCETGTNKLYLFFVCLTRIFLQKFDDVAVGKIWQDQIEHGVMDVTQSNDVNDIWMVEAVGDLEVLGEMLNEYGDELIGLSICLCCAQLPTSII
jgi:hypothetical protein